MSIARTATAAHSAQGSDDGSQPLDVLAAGAGSVLEDFDAQGKGFAAAGLASSSGVVQFVLRLGVLALGIGQSVLCARKALGWRALPGAVGDARCGEQREVERERFTGHAPFSLGGARP